MDKNIRNHDLKITLSIRFCINHFHEDGVITQDIFPTTDGEPDIIVSTDNHKTQYIKGITIIILINR